MTSVREKFGPCEICGSNSWTAVYTGPVRDGGFGILTESSVVARCGTCKVDRLNEDDCKEEEFYVGKDYRESLGQGADAVAFLHKHDIMQTERLQVLPPALLRERKVADIGCAAGSFLDHIKGLPREIIAVEPGTAYHASLQARGFKTYSFTSDALTDHKGTVDWAINFETIEHIPNPRIFLTEIADLLTLEGRVAISTPNRNDAMIDLAGERYRQFFYRVHHRWYFDIESLTECARLCRLELESVAYVQRYSISNAMIWIRDGRPGGDTQIESVDHPTLDAVWRRHFETTGTSDWLYATFKRAES
jgi:SAM-dependent methyltransferase